MILNLAISQINNFPTEEFERFQKLVTTFNFHASKNAQKDKYYEGKISLRDVNLGIAIPETFNKLEIGCAWGAKTVDVLAARSMFDGFVGLNGETVEDVDAIVMDNDLVAAYMKACRDELKLGCTFATLSNGEDNKPKIRFHSPHTAAAVWSGEKNRIDYGFAIVSTAPTNNNNITWEPSEINYYTDTAIWVL